MVRPRLHHDRPRIGCGGRPRFGWEPVLRDSRIHPGGGGSVASGAFERGREGEEAASRYLQEQGWEILARNWRDGPRELDMVVRRGPVVAFVEVKTRSHSAHGSPLDSITRRKRREVERAAAAWLRAQAGLEAPEGTRTTFVRFDAVVVCPDGSVGPRVSHLPDAWRPGWT
jgi:putative endonuclease